MKEFKKTMNGKRSKEIRKLCNQNDSNVLSDIKKTYNKAPEDYKEFNLYKYAKRIWTNSKPENWFK
jgi:hypothetical protein